MTTLHLAVLALALTAAACATHRVPAEIEPAPPITGRPPIPPGVDPHHLHFYDATVGRGDMAPDFTLPLANGGGPVRLSSLRGQPVVLVFGSHTCNIFARDIAGVKKLYEEFSPRAMFLLVYVREAHANDEWIMLPNEKKGLSVMQPVTPEERAAAARDCVADWSLPMATVVDDIEDTYCQIYGGWPDRLYVLDPDGRIAYQGGIGPFGFKPDEVAAVLKERYGF